MNDEAVISIGYSDGARMRPVGGSIHGIAACLLHDGCPGGPNLRLLGELRVVEGVAGAV